MLTNPPMRPQVTDWHVLENMPNGSEAMSLDGRSNGAESSFSSMSFEDLEVEDTFSSVSRPFDMELLRRSIENGSKILGLVEGKDVVLVLGKTGTGKSTLIQAISGRQLCATLHSTTYFDNTVQKTVYEAEDPLPGFEIGHDKCSKTKCINAYVHKEASGKEVVFLDSPGFEDTDGYEVDIATAMMLGQVAKKCHCLRFVVLINYSSLLEDRGEAIRAVLKMAGTFVEDFSEEMKSFMFLFTHTQDIRDMMESPDGPKTCLYHEIVRIAHGTKDKDVLRVLTFMAKSLKKHAPYVDVIEPLGTDFHKMTAAITKNLRPMTKPVLRPDCGLSGRSKLKLEAEVQKLMHQFQLLLKEGGEESALGASNIQQTFFYLSTYLDIGKIRDAAAFCEKLVEDHLRAQVAVVEREIIAGTSEQKLFSVENVNDLKDALIQVKLFSNDGGATHHMVQKRIDDIVLNFAQTVLTKIEGAQFDTLGLDMEKLRIWSMYFGKFSNIHSNAESKVLQIVSERKDNILKFDVRNLESCNDGDLGKLFKDLNVLKLFCDYLFNHFPNEVHDVQCALCNTSNQIKTCLSKWCTESNISLLTYQGPDIEGIRELYARASALERLHTAMNNHGCSNTSLFKKTKEVMMDLEASAVDRYLMTFQSVFHAEDIFSRGDLIKILACAKDAAETARKLHGRGWTNISEVYTRLLGYVKSALLSLSTDVYGRSKEAMKHGMQNGVEDGQLLSKLSTYSWFDDFLLPEEEFVKCAYTRSHRLYVDRSEQVLSISKVLVHQLREEGSNNYGVLKDLKPMVPELHELHNFAFCIGDTALMNALLDLKTSVATYAQDIHRTATNKVYDFNKKMVGNPDTNQLTRIMKELNRLLCETEVIYEMELGEPDPDSLKHLQSKIRKEFQNFSNVAQKTMKAAGSYSNKSKYLSVAQELREIPQEKCRINLDFQSLKEDARQIFNKEASEVQSKLEETSDWDQIDKQLKILEKATILDKFLHDEVSNRIHSLRILCDQKEAKVNDIINSKLSEEDFKGIGGLLVPLVGSKNQLKKEKFGSYKKKICLSLKARQDHIQGCIESRVSQQSLDMIVDGMAVLIEAKKEIGKYLHPEINLFLVIKGLKEKINWKAMKFCSVLASAEAEMNFSTIVSISDKLEMYHAKLKEHFDWNSIRKTGFAKESYDRTLKKLQGAVDDFFESNFDSCPQLLCALTSLKSAASNEPQIPQIIQLYNSTRKVMEDKLNKALQIIHSSVEKTQCYDDAIDAIAALESSFSLGLSQHIRESDLIFPLKTLLHDWRNERKKIASEIYSLQDRNIRKEMKRFRKKLDQQIPSAWKTMTTFLGFTSKKSYSELCLQLDRKVQEFSNKGKSAIASYDYRNIQSCIDSLDIINEEAGNHVKTAAKMSCDLRAMVVERFIHICEEAQAILLSNRHAEFERAFVAFRGFVLWVPAATASTEAKKSFSLINQLLYESLHEAIKKLQALAHTYEFVALKKQVEFVREFGGFLASDFSVFIEETKLYEHLEVEPWQAKMLELLYENFKCGYDFQNIRHYAVLGIPLCSPNHEVERAFKESARICHPDKRKELSGDPGEKFRIVNEARELLVESKDRNITKDHHKVFASLLRQIDNRLRKFVRENLDQQQYDEVEEMLFNLHSLDHLDNLVVPKLDSRRTKESVETLVKNHIKKARVDVETNWNARNYRGLNDCITELRSMEQYFKNYPDIFSKSWSRGIVKEVEKEIEVLAEKAQQYLSSKKNAEENAATFKNYFLQMGFVLVELPIFRDFTKKAMDGVLESCLDESWGYSYLFNFGLSLQRGGDDNEDENRVARVLLTEFRHFKEVMTMVWNEEVSQKPVEDSISNLAAQLRACGGHDGIKKLDIDFDKLLSSYRMFEYEYKSLLSEYIDPAADLKTLADDAMKLAKKIKPASCDEGWGGELKEQLPKILAQVFTLFTVQKSGESYNRISVDGDAEKGEKLLMKPHNIQVLTILLMFGCGSPNRRRLESQVMQIRTGEGKSMILGAATAVLGLLGFSVRCVCYSEYLSNRDFRLFEDVFKAFRLDSIKYSKITKLSEDSTARKGDIRRLTESLLRVNDDGNQIIKSSGASSLKIDHIARHGAGYNGQGELSASNAGVDSSNASINSCTSGAEEIFEILPPQVIPNKEREFSVEFQNTNSIICSTLDRFTSPSQARQNSLEIEHGLQPVSFCHPLKQSVSPARATKEEILLVDEVDVYFCPEFYGRTYNQVAQLREPEVAEIIQSVWNASKQPTCKLRLDDIKSMPAYSKLKQKMPEFDYLIDYEIRIMLDQVRRVDDEPYYLDPITNQIGYKVMDGISYEATYGYRTIFAYLKEAEGGNLKNKDAKLQEVLAMPISCGQFSYANISPARILGVSGTVQAMGDYEKAVLAKYGIDKFLYIPSVYGKSNFMFDKAGRGISIESNMSDYFHRIVDEIVGATKERRAVVVFFPDTIRLKEFVSSSYYHKLGRQKSLLTEDMNEEDKAFVIGKAATNGQVTICPAVFGRGTDFFCKDERVEKNGGVHIIQAFLSGDASEEVQIQGRTARQGKSGTYQMILLESDLVKNFGIGSGQAGQVARADLYDWLCEVRDRRHQQYCETVEKNLVAATEKDSRTHRYFDALLARDHSNAKVLFKEMYLSVKKEHMPSEITLDVALAIDVSGSMKRYANGTVSTLKELLAGKSSLVSKLATEFPEIKFKLRVAVLGYRDIDDQNLQFSDGFGASNSIFTTDISSVIHNINDVTSKSSGGFDIAEDHLGALARCINWNGPNGWNASAKFIILLTDAPTHGMVPNALSSVANVDAYAVRHPGGITAENVVKDLISNDINLCFCSYNPTATSRTVEELKRCYIQNADNKDGKELTYIPMVSNEKSMQAYQSVGTGYQGSHIIFVLDESGSMQNEWGGVKQAYRNYMQKRLDDQNSSDLVSVVQFDGNARVTVDRQLIPNAPNDLPYRGGGTCFYPAAVEACKIARLTPSSHVPTVVFMSDGGTNDAAAAAQEFSALNLEFAQQRGAPLDFHVIAFGSGANTTQLSMIAGSSPKGKLCPVHDSIGLSDVFVDIAASSEVRGVLQAQISKRISESVSDKLSLEYIEGRNQ